MANQFLYSITTGRSGTVFLTELLRANLAQAQVFHERMGFPHFGRDTPEASHFTSFNMVGVTPEIREFWRQKLDRDQATEQRFHAEVSHVLSKAGLMENLHLLSPEAVVYVVALRRDPWKIFWSYVNRFDFFNPGFTWLFTLDPRYRNVIIRADVFREHGMFGIALWYVWEMFARMAYYRLLLADQPQVRFRDIQLEELVRPEGAAAFLQSLDTELVEGEVRIPEKQNATPQEFFGEREKEQARVLFEKLSCDPEALGREYYERGQRLGTPRHLFQPA